MSTRIGVNESLLGIEPEVSIEWPELWAINNEILQVVTLPIYAGESIIGTISLGSKITRLEAEMLKGNSDVDIHIFYGGHLVASTIGDTLSDVDPKDFEQFLKENHTAKTVKLRLHLD